MTLEEATKIIAGKVSGGGIDQTVKFDFGGDGVVFVDGSTVNNSDTEADCTINVSLETLEKVLSGELNPTAAYMNGDFNITGDMGVAMKLDEIL